MHPYINGTFVRGIKKLYMRYMYIICNIKIMNTNIHIF